MFLSPAFPGSTEECGPDSLSRLQRMCMNCHSLSGSLGHRWVKPHAPFILHLQWEAFLGNLKEVFERMLIGYNEDFDFYPVTAQHFI